MHIRRLICCIILVLVSASAFAQQTGAIRGKVTASDGTALPGVTVEARSNVLPQARITTTDAAGEFRLPALQPGSYSLTFSLSGMQNATRRAEVLLSQDTVANASMGVAGVAESITVTAEASLVDRSSAAIQSGLSAQEIQALPVGQEYRDLVKLIPGVQYTQDQTRGPSAGGSGQDNVYQFDGVNVTLPLFGTLSAEPASHDIAQVNIIKGGAKAVDFDRSGGFTIDTLSKSGTNKFFGELSYQNQNHNFNSGPKFNTNSQFDQDRAWTTFNLGGPVVADRLFFYGSYYRPTRTRQNRANLYGELPKFSSVRNEEFGKLTYTPTNSILINGSYRHSNRLDKSDLFAANAAATTGTGNQAKLDVGILEASWVMNPRSYATFKYTDFKNKTQGRPDSPLDVAISTAVGTKLDINNLDRMGLFIVPTLGTDPAGNAFIAPFITKYGFVSPTTGLRTGGGAVGAGDLFNNQDFLRKSGQIGYNLTLGTNTTNDLHFGYQRYRDLEDLLRRSNGFGDIFVLGGTARFPDDPTGKPIFFQAEFQQQSTGAVPTIHSEYRSQNFEVNDTIRWQNWSFNLGVLASNDTLYGQDLREDSSTISGYVFDPGHKYKMYNTPFKKMIQPRLGATWAYNGSDTVYTSYARYNPAASSLPRAASWARNSATTIQAYFDANGVLFATDPIASSSGKLFVPNMTPRTITEYLVGTGQQFTNGFSGRLYGRYRNAKHFWEDTNNNARVAFNPPANIPRDLYIPDLAARRAQIGSGSSYVIAELDGAFTKYYEATAETEWRGGNASLRGSYTWSHYYGNFDQDASTNFNDQNIFIGSSNIADGAGRQLWNNKYGDLHGDRRHLLKLFGSYSLPWNASVGGYTFYQSGQPYELLSYRPYATLTGSKSDTNRYAEPAGSRRTPSHYQLDLNYTQSIPVGRGFNVQLVGDVYNVLNRQTGYNFENRVGNLGLFTDEPNGKDRIAIPGAIPIPVAANPAQQIRSIGAPAPRSFYNPRVFQLLARLQF